MTPPPPQDEAAIHARFARTALLLYGGKTEFEIGIPEGLDEAEVAAAFRAAGCQTTRLTARRTIVVAP